MIASAPQQLSSPPPTPKKRVEPTKRQQPYKNYKSKLWNNKLGLEKTERRAKKTSGRIHSESNDEPDKTRLLRTQQELYNNRRRYMEISDSEHSSDDEDCNATIVHLPEVYSKARNIFRSSAGSYGQPYKYTQFLTNPKRGKRATRRSDRFQYRDKEMNFVRDTAEVQRKKVAIVKERLELFRDYGYGSDSGKARRRSKNVPRRASKEVDMTDEVDSGY